MTVGNNIFEFLHPRINKRKDSNSVFNPAILDQNQINDKLQRFLWLYQRELAPYADRIASVDLRYRNGLAVAWKEGQAVPVSNNQLQRLQ